jgi:hypothetical protein
MVLERQPGSEEVVAVEELALAKVLEECLDAMAAGESDLDALAGRHPRARDEIRPLLDIARLLGERRPKAPPAPLRFVESLRARIESQYSVA